MKYLLSILLFFSLTARATNFYVSSAGSDANAGTLAAPWLTITKVNAMLATRAAGDSILFRMGDTFYGGIILTRSGINFGAYGSGAKPIISGFSTLSGWTLKSTGIYEATVPVTLTAVSMVTINNTPYAMGRYPNSNTTDGGYLHYETFSGATGITDNQLTSTPNWNGADVVVVKNNWTIERRFITAHVGGNITSSVGSNGTNGNYNNPPVYPGLVGYGYFFENDLRTLDQFGEWFYNKATNKIDVVFGGFTPSSYTIKVATIPVLLNIGSYNTISVSNIAFAGSINQAVYAINTRNISVSDCDFTNIGNKAVQIFQSANNLVTRCTVYNALVGGIQLYNGNTNTNQTVTDCTVRNVGLFPGQATTYDNGDMVGVFVQTYANGVIARNRIDSTGLDAIRFQGSNMMIENNWGSHYCATGQDHGGIYTWQGVGRDSLPTPVYTNRIIRNNIFSTTNNCAFISNQPTIPRSNGIYLDGSSKNVEIYGNEIDSAIRNGIILNNPHDVYVHDNIFYSNARSISVQDWAYASIGNLKVAKNVVYTTSTANLSYYFYGIALNNRTSTHYTLRNVLDTIGYADSNYYNNTTVVGWQGEKNDSLSYTGVYKGHTLTSYTLANWKTFSGYELHSTALPTGAALLVRNWSSSKTSYPLSGVYQDEKGTKYYSSISMSAYTYKLLYYVGPITNLIVSATKTNPACFGGTGSITLSASGGVRPYTYSTAGPGGYTSTSNSLTGLAAGNYNTTVTDSVGTTGTAFNTIVIPTQLVASSSAGTITVSGGTTTIVVTATGGTPKVSGYTGTGSFVRGAGSYTFTVTDSLGCSTNTSITLVETVPPTMTIVLTKTNPNCYGEYGSITTSVTGGTGTKTYLWNDGVTTANRSGLIPGNYSVIVTDAAAVKDTAYATITQPSKITVTKDSVGIITVLGGSTTLHLLAVGGTNPLSGVGYFYGLTAGTYYKNISDANGCFIVDTIQVLYQPPSFTIAFTTINDSCYGSANGSVTVTATGATGAVTYAWLPGGQTTQTITGLTAGNYSVVVTDANGTTNTGAVNITQPSPISIDAKFGTVSDSLGTTTVTITATGGTGALSGVGTFTQGIGTTVYTVTDSLGCSATYTVTISITPTNRILIQGFKYNYFNKAF